MYNLTIRMDDETEQKLRGIQKALQAQYGPTVRVTRQMVVKTSLNRHYEYLQKLEADRDRPRKR